MKENFTGCTIFLQRVFTLSSARHIGLGPIILIHSGIELNEGRIAVVLKIFYLSFTPTLKLWPSRLRVWCIHQDSSSWQVLNSNPCCLSSPWLSKSPLCFCGKLFSLLPFVALKFGKYLEWKMNWVSGSVLCTHSHQNIDVWTLKFSFFPAPWGHQYLCQCHWFSSKAKFRFSASCPCPESANTSRYKQLQCVSSP